MCEFGAHFLNKKELKKRFPNGDGHLSGYFLRDPSLKDFVRSGAAACGMLRMLEGFWTDNSMQQCMDLIEAYADGGGDQGHTM